MSPKIIDELFERARASGRFENLRGRGRPLDHSEYFSAPERERVAYHLLHIAGFVPEEVELRRKIAGLEERMAQSSEPTERLHVLHQIERLRIRLDLLA